MQTSQKKKASDPSLNDCANCGTIGAKLACAKCKATHYCTKACQKQHWKHGHKAMCVTPEERRPHVTASAADKSNRGTAGEDDAEGNSGECPICLESLSGGTLCTLPCKHEFHGDCVEELRKQGVQQACPLCRSALLPGPIQLFEDATRLYVRVEARHRTEEGSWKPLTAAEEVDMARVVDMWTNASNQGILHAHFNMGLIYFAGRGVAQDYNEAVRWYRKAADQGQASAQFNLGTMYHEGEGVSRDYNETVRWLRKAADQGYANAQLYLGAMYSDGEGVAQDSKKAVQWFRKAADQGHANAQFNLGAMYSEGKGVSQDSKKAVHWYRKAADLGLASAQFNLGVIYDNGSGGVSKDFKKAVQWFRKAADQGHANAQFNLGAMYSEGEGVARDYNETVRLFRNAANQGHAGAQVELGEIYFSGPNGFPKDLELARFFLSAAETQGDERARLILKKLEAALHHSFNDCSNHNAPPSSQCTCCGRSAGDDVKLKPCPRCKGPLYCGKDCQRKHWKDGHKEHCPRK